MHISFNRDDFIKEFSLAAAFADDNSFHNSVVKVEATKDKVHLSARGLGSEIKLVSHASVEDAGSLLTRSWLLRKVLGECDWSLVKIGTDGTMMSIDCAKSNWKLQLPDVNVFDPVKDFASTSYYIIKAEELLKAINAVSFAVDDTGNARYALACVQMEFDGPSLNLTATDGKKLMRAELKTIPVCDPSSCRYLLRRESIKSMTAALRHAEGNLQVAFDNNHASMRIGDTSIWILGEDGRYPETKAFFEPSKYSDSEITFNPSVMLRALLQLRSMTDVDSSAVTFNVNENQIVMSVGKSKVEMDSAMIYPHDMEVTLDIRFVINFLRTIDPEVMAIKWQGPSENNSPHRFTHDNITFIAMPMEKPV